MFTCHACSSPLERDPHRSYLFQWLFTCLTPERVIHTTHMDPRDLGFSLIDNWCVVWGPPFMAQFYFLSHRCPISHRPHYTVEDTSVHPGDRRLTTPWHLGSRALRDTGPRLSWNPAYVTPSLLVINDARGLVSTTHIFNYMIYVCSLFHEVNLKLSYRYGMKHRVADNDLYKYYVLCFNLSFIKVLSIILLSYKISYLIYMIQPFPLHNFPKIFFTYFEFCFYTLENLF